MELLGRSGDSKKSLCIGPWDFGFRGLALGLGLGIGLGYGIGGLGFIWSLRCFRNRRGFIGLRSLNNNPQGFAVPLAKAHVGLLQ